jgi:hypothetical protein
MSYSPRYGFIEDIGEKTDNRCHICHDEAHPDDYGSPGGPLKGRATTVDHIVPQSHGGDDHPDNLLLAHADCNSSRGTRPVEEARLQHAGTTDKPFSTGEEQLIAEYRQELAIQQSRERDGLAAVLVVAIGGGLIWLGATLWKAWKAKQKASQRPRGPVVPVTTAKPIVPVTAAKPIVLATAAKPPQIEPQVREAATLPRELDPPSEPAILGGFEQQQLPSAAVSSETDSVPPSTGHDAGPDNVRIPESGEAATTPVSAVVE